MAGYTKQTNIAKTCTTGMANTIIGVLLYIFLIVPILTFTIVSTMNLSGSHGIAIAFSLVITGLYVTEKTAGRDV
jgi:hypothetical protein